MRRTLSAVLLALLLGAPARAADPAGDLLRLVPPDAAICVVVRDLRTHLRTLAESPFAAWARESPLGKQLADPAQLAKIDALAGSLADQLGVTVDQLRDDIFGDAIVFAYQPGPPGKPQEEVGLVFLHARKPDALAKLIGRLNELQQKSGEVRAVREKSHRGRAYFERVKTGDGREYYYLRDGRFAFSSREDAIRRVIEQDLADAQAPNRVAAGLTALGLTDKLLVCWFNPRGFDAELTTQVANAKHPNEKAFLAQFHNVWAATKDVALYATPGRQLEVGLAASFDSGRLPKEVREVLFPPPGASALWSVVPDNAILAVGGRLSVPKLLAVVGSFLPPDGRAGLTVALEQGLGPIVGRDKLPAVLAGLGPDWAAWVAPPAAGSWLPAGVAALRLTDQQSAITQAVDFAAQMARFHYNRTHTAQIERRDETRNGVTVRTFTGDAAFPAGLRPAYAVTGGYLLLATSPAALRHFQPPTPRPDADAPLARLSARHLREYLAAHRAKVAAVVAGWSGRAAADIERELTNFAAVLELFDRVELRSTAADGKVRLVLHIQFVKPLSK
jgi:hypothetical protein